MSSPQDAALSGAAHLTSFFGTDTVIAIDLLEKYYNASSDRELVGCSVPATEHSVMCMGMEDGELATFRRLITEIYPAGIVSIVSDSWDFWRVMTEYLPALKHQITDRKGKVVIRPDSGDPVEIICGNYNAEPGTPEYKGAVEILWDIFGGTTNKEGYRFLDEHIGLIYGDSITLERAERILTRLKGKGFGSTNIVFGVGSYTYQYTSRDVFGFAVKATYGEVNGEGRNIFKNPKTDDGTKRSAKGLLSVDSVAEGEGYVLHQEASHQEEQGGRLLPVFRNGILANKPSLYSIRSRLEYELRRI
jgi:nicotinamide phosphoribosyltransferase